MIILDEQLLKQSIRVAIAKWYRGSVRVVPDLRPQTVIKDDAIPDLLRRENQPTFVTINEKDFWKKVPIDSLFCVVCFPLPYTRVDEIPQALRALFRHPEFKTKAARMGKVIRVSQKGIAYYNFDERKIRRIPTGVNKF